MTVNLKSSVLIALIVGVSALSACGGIESDELGVEEQYLLERDVKLETGSPGSGGGFCPVRLGSTICTCDSGKLRGRLGSENASSSNCESVVFPSDVAGYCYIDRNGDDLGDHVDVSEGGERCGTILK